MDTLTIKEHNERLAEKGFKVAIELVVLINGKERIILFDNQKELSVIEGSLNFGLSQMSEPFTKTADGRTRYKTPIGEVETYARVVNVPIEVQEVK